jgi:hypothetical protein
VKFISLGRGIQNPTTTADRTTIEFGASAPGLLKRVWVTWLLPALGELAIPNGVDVRSPVVPLLSIASEVMTGEHRRMPIVHQHILDVLSETASVPWTALRAGSCSPAAPRKVPAMAPRRDQGRDELQPCSARRGAPAIS